MIKFGTDGIRGEYPDVVNEDVLYRIGKVLSLYNQKVIIGYDTRFSSISLAKSLYCSLDEEKIDVISIGLSSTPKMMYISKLDHCLCVMITASHNKYIDNGIKIFINGEKIAEEMKKNIETNYDENLVYKQKLIDYKEKEDIRYEKFIESFLQNNKYKILMDTAFGAVSIIEKIKLNNITLINTEYNGYNINDGVGALYAEHLLTKVQEGNYDYGFAFDGDGDRVIMCDKEKIYDGDDIVYFLAKNILKKQDSIVVTVMSNRGLIKSLEKYNIRTLTCDVGDEIVYQTLKDNALILGGEKAGHIIISSYLSCGDGLFIALNIINLLNSNNLKFKEYISDKQDFFQYNLNYSKEISREKMEKLNSLIEECQGNERIFIRKSGTEKLYRILIETEKQENIQQYLDRINKILKGE